MSQSSSSDDEPLKPFASSGLSQNVHQVALSPNSDKSGHSEESEDLSNDKLSNDSENDKESTSPLEEPLEPLKFMYCFVCKGHCIVTKENCHPFPYLLIDKDVGAIVIRQPMETTTYGNSATKGFKSFPPNYIPLDYTIAEECRQRESSKPRHSEASQTWPPTKQDATKYLNILNHMLPAKSQLVCWNCAQLHLNSFK